MSTLRAMQHIATALVCFVAFQVFAQAPDSVPRKKVALVLSGGGARGLAHIGVLKVLREQRVPVDLIVATSMGSIVGGAYAAGRTPAELEALVEQADWDLMFSDRPPREDLSFRRKEDDQRLIGKTELGITRKGIVLPRGAFGSQNLEEFLRHVVRSAGDDRRLEDRPLAFHAVATDLVTGEQVVLSDVPLPIAMRASMSIPGAFSPTQVGDRLLGDGGLTRNLPIEVARQLGADVIIAVNVGTPLLPRSSLNSAFGVAQQMINILTEQNVAISIAALRPGDILISPDLSGVSFLDFERGKELIALGEEAARASAGQLARLAADPVQYARWETNRTWPSTTHERPVAAVRVEGAVRTNPDALKREIRDRTGIEPGKEVTDEQLVKASRILYGMADFERVDVRSQIEEGGRVIVVDVDEKAWGPSYLRFGGQAVYDSQSETRFSVIAQHTQTWINAWGAEWRNELQIGDVQRATTSLYQPLGPGSPWFVEGMLEYAKSSYDLFGTNLRRTDRVTTSTGTAALLLGRRIANIGVVRAGIGHQEYGARPAIGTRIPGPMKDSADYALLGVNFDTLDDTNFPRRGFLFGGATTRHWFDGGDKPVQAYVAETLLPYTWDRFTLLGIGALGSTKSENASFALGGFLNLSGTPVGGISGAHLLSGAALAYYRIGELPRPLGRGWYAGASIEAGNAWRSRSEVSLGDMRTAASMFLGFDTIAGPLYLGWGHTFGGSSAFYVFLGRPTNRVQRDF